jgi:CBS domain-containing protein
MDRDNNHGSVMRRCSWKLGELFASLAKKLKYPALASVPVSAAMLSRVDAVSPQQPLEDAAQLLVSGRHAQVPVIDRGRPIGVITRGDVAVALQTSGPRTLIGAASCHRVLAVEPGDSLAGVIDRLRAVPDSVALVLDHGAPVGLLTLEHLAAYLAQGKKAA